MASMEMAFSFKRFSFLVAAACLSFFASSCRPRALQADFPRVPGSVLAGDIRGPFTGRVTDRGTGRPVPLARVVVTWIYRRGVGSASPAGYVRFVGHTDLDGRYRVPSVRRVRHVGLEPLPVEGHFVPTPRRGGPGGKGALTDVRIMVYKRGYVAYRSDRVFPEGRPRLDFAQLDNHVRLDKLSDDVSRVAHLRFIGDVRALGADGRWELEAASEELSGRVLSRTQESAKPIDVSRLMEESDLEVLFGAKLVYKVGRLATMKRTRDSDSLHFEAVGKPQTFDLAVRVWRRPGAELEKFYRKLQHEYPGSRSMDQVGDHSFAAGDDKIFAHVFLDRAHKVVVSVTCGKDLCKNSDGVLKAARLVHDRLDRLEREERTEERGPRLKVPGLPGRGNKPSYVPRLNR